MSPEQSRAFIAKAREIEANEERSAADELIKRQQDGRKNNALSM
ncbi:hypothetical protein [Bradyrhizobium sp. STM 3561]